MCVLFSKRADITNQMRFTPTTQAVVGLLNAAILAPLIRFAVLAAALAVVKLVLADQLQWAMQNRWTD